MGIGDEIRDRLFRDTRDCYLETGPSQAAPALLRFARRHCGHRVLDLGCATGDYALELQREGHEVVGADIHPGYVEAARRRGLQAHLVSDRLPFDDRSFDTVLLFEVVEHAEDPAALLREAARVGRRNILLTVPHCGGWAELRRFGLTFEHFLERDHRNFFTEESLRAFLLDLFTDVRVRPGDPISPAAAIPRSPLALAVRALARLRLLRPRFYFRLYAVIGLGGGS